MQILPVWEIGVHIAKFNSPRIFMSEGCEPVENTGFAGQIVISWFIVVLSLRNHYFWKTLQCNELEVVGHFSMLASILR